MTLVMYECRAQRRFSDEHFDMRLLSNAALRLLDRYSHMRIAIFSSPPSEPNGTELEEVD